VDEKCGMPMFLKKGFEPTSHCGLPKHHLGKCMAQVVTNSESERISSGQLDLDLNDLWKPIRDISDEDIPIYIIEDEL
jgi:hypothetical protein